MGEVRIRLQNISKYYYSEASVTQALRKVDLSFEMNEFVAITGESGSGKSTLLKVISGMEGFDEGELFIDGQPTSQYDDDEWESYRREKIGYIFQDYSLIGHYSARDNIVSALMIMGLEQKAAIEQANQYLKRVGLAGQEEQKASELSSGQKQRLSIARALAKGTDIIVADEPTGNLDSETGEQIVRLLKELSRDHLVIMVTHNYEQIESYATRKIRLHDGDLVLDVGNEGDVKLTRENGDQFANQGTNPSEQQERGEGSNRGSNLSGNQEGEKVSDRARSYMHRVAAYLSALDIRTQKSTIALFLFFFLVISTVSFFFIGQLLMDADDRISMEYDDSAFPQEDKTRISAKRQDGKPITDQDLDKIKSLRHVVTVDQYDTVNDVNYYYRQDKDYQFQYGFIGEEREDTESIEFLDDSHFMRSSVLIGKEDLAAGKLPEKRGEVVLYSKDGEKTIGTSFTCYMRNKPILGSSNYVRWDCTVVGVLKEKTEQIYFSPAMCQMLTVTMDSSTYNMTYFFDMKENRFLGNDQFIPLIGEDLREDEMQVSEHYKVPVDGLGKMSPNPRKVFGGSNDYLEIIPKNAQGKQQETITLSAEKVSTEVLHQSGGSFLAISSAYFDRYNDVNSYQAAVYISSYAKTDEVLAALQDAGYDGVSTFQASVWEYDQEKVEARLIRMGIALAVLLVTMIISILILGSLMKLRGKDYYVWKFMGMETKLMHRISYYETGVYLVVATLLTVLLMQLAKLRFPLIHEMFYYYEIPGCMCFIAYNLLVAILAVAVFHRSLERGMVE